MDEVFKLLFERELSADEPKEKKAAGDGSKESPGTGDFHITDGFNPTDSRYDPQLRLKRSLKRLFPHLPFIPGLPASILEDPDQA